MNIGRARERNAAPLVITLLSETHSLFIYLMEDVISHRWKLWSTASQRTVPEFGLKRDMTWTDKRTWPGVAFAAHDMYATTKCSS